MIGNWGLSFFGPLASGNVAETYYDIGITFEQTLVIATICSIKSKLNKTTRVYNLL